MYEVKIEPKRTFNPAVVALGVVVLLLAVGAALAYYDRENQIESFNEQLVAANVSHCNNIEALKRLAREGDEERYAHLNETLALLGLKHTPAIEKRALETRDEILRDFAAKSCPAGSVDATSIGGGGIGGR